ncbi:ABC transporter permease [Parapusillimonas sp. SGNA-6]|nr:ABC transporter permease [Parapusillimonas sp. SGNA-6]
MVEQLKKLRRVSISRVVAVLVVLFLLLPFIVIVGASFDPGGGYQIHFPPREFSLSSYAAIPPKYLSALGTSALIGVIVSLLAAVVGLLASLAIVRGGFRHAEVLQAAFRLPLQIPLIVTGAVFLQFYYVISSAYEINLLKSIWGVVIAHLFIAIPYCVGSISSVLLRLEGSVEEAAQTLGASHWNVFMKVTFPMLKAGLVSGLFYAFILSFSDVPVALFLVNAETMTLPVLMFQDMQFDFHPSMLAMSTIVILFSVALIFGIQKVAGLDLVNTSQTK